MVFLDLFLLVGIAVICAFGLGALSGKEEEDYSPRGRANNFRRHR